MVIFFDIDGTIIDNETQIIPESTLRAVKILGERGHLAVVNTGRPYAHIDPRIRKIPFGGWVCGCGMEIMLKGRWLVRRAPELSLCAQVRDIVRQCGMQVLYEAREGAVYTDGAYSLHPAIRREAEQMAAKGFTVRELDSLDAPEFMKFITYDGENCRREAFIQGITPWFDHIDRGDTMLELVLKGCTKAGGMLELLSHLGVSREDTMAIGDSTNDLPMFSVAGHTVCLGGGMEELKAEAEFITDTVMNDGIEKALIHFGLL